eukprot:27762-Karenia_brevis.AAC.1
MSSRVGSLVVGAVVLGAMFPGVCAERAAEAAALAAGWHLGQVPWNLVLRVREHCVHIVKLCSVKKGAGIAPVSSPTECRLR